MRIADYKECPAILHANSTIPPFTFSQFIYLIAACRAVFKIRNPKSPIRNYIISLGSTIAPFTAAAAAESGLIR
jgi:hypothetical protein